MKPDSQIRRKAMKAIQAVTASAVLFAGVSCSPDDDIRDPSWNLQEGDTGNDATADADATVDDTGDAMVDAATRCNAEESTGVCPAECTMDNDIDCCESNNGCWDSGVCWEGGCAVPGPFVPPRMAA